jgi:hypothetical protein
MTSHNETTKIMGPITKGSGVIDVVPNGGFIKVTMKARLSNFFTKKEMKTKRT